jgi:hypothetical protein
MLVLACGTTEKSGDGMLFPMLLLAMIEHE